MGLSLRLEHHLGQAPERRWTRRPGRGLLLSKRDRNPPLWRQGDNADALAGAVAGQHDRDEEAGALPEARRTV